tara:strand:- start:159 stop:965 length:807 start_codon:yes stop_codon:yes gene_type:complete
LISNSKKKILIHFIYGVFLFVSCLSVLEQFSQLNEDLFHFSNTLFHFLTVAISLSIAVLEGYHMKGFDTIKSILEDDDPVPPPINENYTTRPLEREEIILLSRTAKKMYPSKYSFPIDQLERWWDSNPNCFFCLFLNDSLVGCIDLVPISTNDYEHLISGGNEHEITPLSVEQVADGTILYIASFMVQKEHRRHLSKFIDASKRFLTRTYKSFNWEIICAQAYTENGLNLINSKGFYNSHSNNIWYLEKSQLSNINSKNKRFWMRFFS